jgi:alkane 1-monooxygenase
VTQFTKLSPAGFLQTLLQLRYALPLAMPLALFFAGYCAHGDPKNADWWMLFPFLTTYGLTTVLDYCLGIAQDDSSSAGHTRMTKMLVLLALPMQVAIVVCGAYLTQALALSWLGHLFLVLAVGTLAGAVGITGAHELIHRPSIFERIAGGLTLTLVCYGSFKIEHMHGHHANVGTALDASSARKWQTIYNFVPRAIVRHFITAWRIECTQRAQRGRMPLPLELMAWYSISTLWAALCFLIAGWWGVAYFVGQAVFSIIQLECTNYVEHYALRRKMLPNGSYEKVQAQHTWNSGYCLSNWLLYNLQRHADHHANAARPYAELRNLKSSPQLPGGYAPMILLALIPSMWFRIIHPRLPKHLVNMS